MCNQCPTVTLLYFFEDGLGGLIFATEMCLLLYILSQKKHDLFIFMKETKYLKPEIFSKFWYGVRGNDGELTAEREAIKSRKGDVKIIDSRWRFHFIYSRSFGKHQPGDL